MKIFQWAKSTNHQNPLHYSSLNNLDLQNADLEGIYLVDADMESSDLTRVNLSNSSTYQEWDIPLDRGMKGAHIYSLSCDDEWVWFLTNNGIIFYNWTTYNNAQN